MRITNKRRTPGALTPNAPLTQVALREATVANNNNTAHSSLSQAVAEVPAESTETQKPSKVEELARTVSYIMLFESVDPSKIEQLADSASSFVDPEDHYQAGLLAALKECASSAKSGKPMRLSPELHQLSADIFAAMLYEQVIVRAECRAEEIQAALMRHSPWK